MTLVRSTICRSTVLPGKSAPVNLITRRSRTRRYGHGSILGSAQIARDLVLVHGPHHQFKQQMVASGVELDGLGDVAIFLLDRLVVGSNVHGELAALGIRLL